MPNSVDTVQFALPPHSVCTTNDVRYLTTVICEAHKLPDWPHELRATATGKKLDRSAKIAAAVSDGMELSLHNHVMSFEVDVRIDEKHRSFLMRAPKDAAVCTVLQHLLNDLFAVAFERVVIGECTGNKYNDSQCSVTRPTSTRSCI